MAKTLLDFFAKQRRIYPRRVWGRYRKLKWVAMITLLGIYYLAPWIRWDRGPHLPDQAILIDMPSRRAYFFFIEIWPQEVYYLTGILILAAVGLFFVTSMFGRVWCGYACPQTVWTDLFVWVERIIQGDRNARMKLDKAPLGFEKIYKKGLTHLIWLVIGLCTGGAWVFYFNDAPTLVDHLLHFDVPWTIGSWILALTFSTYIMAGYAREQVCTYMCPYARFQSAMFDKDTLIISYDTDRGEPRGSHKQGDSWEGRGHCIDCNQCVVVCPMGIDIRKGLQMECIACGLCVDACNNVMDKVGLPKGLIRYDTTHNLEQRSLAKKEGKSWKEHMHLVRPRTFYYAGVLTLVISLMVYSLSTRSTWEVHALHDRNPLFVRLSEGGVRNNYTIKILNKTHDDMDVALSVEGVDNASITVQSAGTITPEALTVLADSVGQFRVMVTVSGELTKDRYPITFMIRNKQTNAVIEHEAVFVTR